MSSRRVLHCAGFFYLDNSNGAAIANRALMECLSRQGFAVEALCGPVVDGPGGLETLAVLSRSDPACSLTAVAEGGSILTVGASGVQPGAVAYVRAMVQGVAISALHRTLRRVGPAIRDEEEAAEFLSLFDATVARFGPDVLVTYGGDPVTREILSRARRQGIATVFTLHNFGYPNPSYFAHVDAILVPSEYSARHHRKVLGLDCAAMPNLVDPTRIRATDADPRYLTFVNPSAEKGVHVFARIADEMGRSRPDIPLLVVESRGDEANLASCGIDLRVHGNVFLMSQTEDPRDFWGVTRICLVPSLWRESQGLVAAEAMVNGIPVIASDRGALPETLGESGILIRIPGRLTPATRELPTADDVKPWIDAIVRLWDDADFYATHRQRALTESRRWAPEVLEPRIAQFFGEARSRDRIAPPRGDVLSGIVPDIGHPAVSSIEGALQTIGRRWPGLVKHCDDDPIVVLAAGRGCGSALLRRMIAHRCFLVEGLPGDARLIDSLADQLQGLSGGWSEPDRSDRRDDAGAPGKGPVGGPYPSVHDLIRAQQELFRRILAEPARRAGSARWGLEETRLGVEHAVYLHWLFPGARFLFLIRNPYDAWCSHAARAARGRRRYDHRPGEPVTAHSFAARWRQLVTGFLNDHPKANGLVVRHEDLEQGDHADIEEYLGFALSPGDGPFEPSDAGPPPADLQDTDRAALDAVLGTLAASLGYASRTGDREPARASTTPGIDAFPSGTIDSAPSQAAAATGRSRASPTDPAKCVVLVAVGHHIEPACDDALRMLEWRGYTVRRVLGYSAIDQGRNQIATDALRDGFEELLWIDSDIVFEPDAVERLRSHHLPITCGAYPKKGTRSFASNFAAGTKQVAFGISGGLVEIPYSGAGFLHTRREVYLAIRQRFRLPPCNERFGPSMIPFFQPLVVPDGSGHWYLAEDYSFCHRARECGYRIMADTTIRLMHIGSYAYGWEDAGGGRDRYDDYTFRVTD